MDQRKLIFNSIARKINHEFPDVYVSQRYELVPKQIPCVFIEQISKIRIRRYATLDNSDDQYRFTFEVQVFANTLAEGYELMDYVEECFKSIAFFEEMCRPVDNADLSTFRMIARFSAQVGGTPYEMSTL